jgi:hypothetical protein
MIDLPLNCMFFAFIGGVFGSIIKLLEMRGKPIKEQATLNWVYWAFFFIFPLFGVFLVYVYTYDGAQLSAMAAVNIGVSAPLIFKTIYGAIPKEISPSRID